MIRRDRTIEPRLLYKHIPKIPVRHEQGKVGRLFGAGVMAGAYDCTPRFDTNVTL
jgi:hypothetical protein